MKIYTYDMEIYFTQKHVTRILNLIIATGNNYNILHNRFLFSVIGDDYIYFLFRIKAIRYNEDESLKFIIIYFSSFSLINFTNVHIEYIPKYLLYLSKIAKSSSRGLFVYHFFVTRNIWKLNVQIQKIEKIMYCLLLKLENSHQCCWLEKILEKIWIN